MFSAGREVMYIVALFAGAWIEIYYYISMADCIFVAPFAGAWIEIFSFLQTFINSIVTPFAGTE